MGSKILGIGAAVPPIVVTNKDFESRLDTSDEWIVTRTGIRERRYAPPEVQLSDLAAEAAEHAFTTSGVDRAEIDAVVLATATPETLYPSTACWTQPKLGIRNVPCFDVSAGCSGFLYSLIVGNGLLAAGTARRVLVIGAEMLTRAVNQQDRNTAVLFGDGAGAAVLAPSTNGEGILASVWGADGSLGELLVQPAGGTRLQASHETVENNQHAVQMSGNEVFRYAVKAMQNATMEVLERANVSPDQVDLFVPHQANLRIINACVERAGFPMEKVMVTVDRYGNTSAASIPTALRDAEAEGRLKKGDLVLASAFGAGFTWASVLIRW